MTKDRLPLAELMQKAGGDDFLRLGAEAVIQEAWIGGLSTRRVNDLVQAMGLSGISKSTVSKVCKDIGDRVHAFLDRPLSGDWPDLRLDAAYLKQREGGRIVSVAALTAAAAAGLTLEIRIREAV